MPEHIPGSNMVILFEGEYVEATDGRRIEGEQIIRVHEFDTDTIQVQGKIMDRQNPSNDAKWEVEANDLEDLMTKVKKNS
jgi:hypothetical protein